ncbi:MAG: hypothetical protein D5R96_03300 [Methanocalculus sp. MSAO_Arc2]|nr:MAG: hypothetical protein D5R96_03300 [Methanocalculus sp. MSAO_Arc2]
MDHIGIRGGSGAWWNIPSLRSNRLFTGLIPVKTLGAVDLIHGHGSIREKHDPGAVAGVQSSGINSDCYLFILLS